MKSITGLVLVAILFTLTANKVYCQHISFGDGIEAMKDSVTSSSKNITCFEFRTLAQYYNNKLVQSHQGSKIPDLKEINLITKKNKNYNDALKTASQNSDARIDCSKDQTIKINSLALTAKRIDIRPIGLFQKQIQPRIYALSEFLFRGICLQILNR
jgi:hypothetical protein